MSETFAIYQGCRCQRNCNNLKVSKARCRARVHYWRDRSHVYQCSLGPTVATELDGKEILLCRVHARMSGWEQELTGDGLLQVLRSRMRILEEAGDAMAAELRTINPESWSSAAWNDLRVKERDNYSNSIGGKGVMPK